MRLDVDWTMDEFKELKRETKGNMEKHEPKTERKTEEKEGEKKHLDYSDTIVDH